MREETVTAVIQTHVLRVVGVKEIHGVNRFEVFMVNPASKAEVRIEMEGHKKPPQIDDGVTWRLLSTEKLEVSIYSVGRYIFCTIVLVR